MFTFLLFYKKFTFSTLQLLFLAKLTVFDAIFRYNNFWYSWLRINRINNSTIGDIEC